MDGVREFWDEQAAPVDEDVLWAPGSRGGVGERVDLLKPGGVLCS